MVNTVFILGAGCSKSSGVPTMDEFWDRSRELWLSGQLSHLEDHFERVNKARLSLQKTQAKANIDYANLEKFVTALEFSKLIDWLPLFASEEIGDAIQSVKKIIVATIEHELGFEANGEQKPYPPKAYNEFVVLLNHLKDHSTPAHNISILTFNYDIGLDYSLYYHGKGPEYCLDTDALHDDEINLLKLHGSTNWFRTKDQDIIEPHDFDSYFLDFSFEDKEEGKCQLKVSELLGDRYPEKAWEQIPFVAPPVWNKAEYHNSLRGVWIKAAKALQNADNIFIPGFSMPESDLFFKFLYGLGSTGDSNMDKVLQRVWVFNPDDSVKERYHSLFGTAAEGVYKFNPSINSENIPTEYKPEGIFRNAIYKIAEEFNLENQFPGDNFISVA
jgi:hypothetical protein